MWYVRDAHACGTLYVHTSYDLTRFLHESNPCVVQIHNWTSKICSSEHIKTILESNKLSECTTEDSIARDMELLNIRHHLCEKIKSLYLTNDPSELWTDLENRNCIQEVIHTKALQGWIKLRFRDYKSVEECDFALLKIVFEMKLCGEVVTDVDMLENTFSTFHPTNLLLQQQYREMGFTTYTSLIARLLQAEQNHELLMNSSEKEFTRPTPLPPTNALPAKRADLKTNHVKRGYGRGGWSKMCNNCGMDNHLDKRCRTPKHLTTIYHQSFKRKAKMVRKDEGKLSKMFSWIMTSVVGWITRKDDPTTHKRIDYHME